MEILREGSTMICRDRKHTLIIPKKILVGLKWIKVKKENKNFEVEIIPNLKDGTIILKKKDSLPTDVNQYWDRVTAWLYYIHRKKGIEEIRKNRERIVKQTRGQIFNFDKVPKEKIKEELKNID